MRIDLRTRNPARASTVPALAICEQTLLSGGQLFLDHDFVFLAETTVAAGAAP